MTTTTTTTVTTAPPEKHAPAAHSTLDALWVLYDKVLRVTPDTVDDPGRDRFLAPDIAAATALVREGTLAAAAAHPLPDLDTDA